MPALTILVIRHAEKPDDPALGPGLTQQSAEDKHSLVLRGWVRAGAWAALFGSARGGSDFPKPDTVYAANPDNPSEEESRSRRPFETIVPLCERLGVQPVTTFGVGDETGLIASVTQQSGVALICWEHKKIVESVLPAIAGGQAIAGMPAKWDGARFDVVLRFDREGDAPWSFRQLFPQLLGGDMNAPLDG